MRIWISKNNGVSIREQLVRQVILGILSGDLAIGERLPSARTLARMHAIHMNTVIAAFQELQDRNWLEARRGSGLFVRKQHPENGIDSVLVTAIELAKSSGISPDQLLYRLQTLLESTAIEAVVVHEPEPQLAAILCEEIQTYLQVPVSLSGDGRRALTVHLAHRGRPQTIGKTMDLVLRSIPDSITGQSCPSPDQTVTIATASDLFRRGARAVLAAVGIDPISLRNLDTRERDWVNRLDSKGILIVDVLTAKQVHHTPGLRVFRVIADASLEEIKAKF
jgi:DNA-binding transcriptional regulator YhcF (GntR family)